MPQPCQDSLQDVLRSAFRMIRTSPLMPQHALASILSAQNHSALPSQLLCPEATPFERCWGYSPSGCCVSWIRLRDLLATDSPNKGGTSLSAQLGVAHRRMRERWLPLLPQTRRPAPFSVATHPSTTKCPKVTRTTSRVRRNNIVSRLGRSSTSPKHSPTARADSHGV